MVFAMKVVLRMIITMVSGKKYGIMVKSLKASMSTDTRLVASLSGKINHRTMELGIMK